MRSIIVLLALINIATCGYLTKSHNHLTKRSDNLIIFCSEPGGQGTCRTARIDDKALRAGFDIDGGDLNKGIGFGPASAKLDTPGMICGIAHQKRTSCNFLCITAVGHCQGDRVIVTNEKFVDLTGNLFRNAQCMGCFKSPGA
ncbi:hypothetical protein B0J11DRAFT_575750 [Dendryphion nanum]|uniref:Secreted protein n=1 Tax=Dendryphion nanum TaxID=256645 RepID=A0A9P9ECZ1_9PLEO|nr:hypothetical protein B0J11DRAFT_575750 [Dendryphion nanum]